MSLSETPQYVYLVCSSEERYTPEIFGVFSSEKNASILKNYLAKSRPTTKVVIRPWVIDNQMAQIQE